MLSTNVDKLVTVNLSAGGKETSVFFKSENYKLDLSTESIIAALLLPRMKNGDSISVQQPADHNFLDGIDQIQDIFRVWDDQFSKIDIKAIPTEESTPGKGVGVFFTGGVDSYYTFLKNKDDITHLIYVHGLDVTLNNSELRNKVTTVLRDTAKDFNKKVIEIETNLRGFLKPLVKWGVVHGAVLASIGHLLKLHLKKIYIPATYTYAHLFQWGSHPLVDPLWSSTQLEFVHDGCEATRVEKIAFIISRYETALQSLRVCYKNKKGVYNCGQCEKCLRTMLSLKANGVLEKTPTFTEPLLARKLARIKVYDKRDYPLITDNLKALQKTKGNKHLVYAIKWALIKSRFLYPFRFMIKTVLSKLRLKTGKV